VCLLTLIVLNKHKKFVIDLNNVFDMLLINNEQNPDEIGHCANLKQW